MKRVVVLGTGMVGRAIAADLCHEFAVTSVDADASALDALQASHPLAIRHADLTQEAAIREAVADADLVIGALPGHMGFRALQTVIDSGKNAVDISFFPEDAFELDDLARKKGVTAVVDCGVAPGLGNLILGYHYARMNVESFACFVGGLPVKRSWPWNYKAPFSPIDVLEEYTRPARLVESGKIVTRPALSDVEWVEIEPIGTLEAFNTDGLRTLLRTVNVPFMKEKTLRYPGHAALMRVFREQGFFNTTPLVLNGVSVRPLDVTSALLFEQWRYAPGEPEFTVLLASVRGLENGEPREMIYRLYDKTDETTGISSMARTTGYTCTAVARLLLDGTFAKPGIIPPELISADAICFERVLASLQERGVNLTREVRVS